MFLTERCPRWTFILCRPMIGRFSLLLHFLAALFKLRERLEAEDAALRQQLIVFARWVPSEVPPPANTDRLIFLRLYRQGAGAFIS